jgi:hypothetical protein
MAIPLQLCHDIHSVTLQGNARKVNGADLSEILARSMSESYQLVQVVDVQRQFYKRVFCPGSR